MSVIEERKDIAAMMLQSVHIELAKFVENDLAKSKRISIIEKPTDRSLFKQYIYNIYIMFDDIFDLFPEPFFKNEALTIKKIKELDLVLNNLLNDVLAEHKNRLIMDFCCAENYENHLYIRPLKFSDVGIDYRNENYYLNFVIYRKTDY